VAKKGNFGAEKQEESLNPFVKKNLSNLQLESHYIYSVNAVNNYEMVTK